MLTNNYLNNIEYSRLKTKLDEIISYEPSKIMDNFDKIKSFNSSTLNELYINENMILDELILDFFENKFLLYFNRIKYLDDELKEKLFPLYYKDSKNDNLIIFDLSLKLFNKVVDILDELSNIKSSEKSFVKLYSISFLKLYLFKFIELTKNDFSRIEEYKEIFLVINDINNKSFKKVVFIYILKLYYYYFDNNFEKLKFFLNSKLNKIIEYDFSLFQEDEDTLIINYFLFPVEKDKYEKYLHNLKKFESIKKENFADKESTKEFITNLLNSKDIDIFITISINKIFFCLYSNFDETKFEEYKNFFLIAEQILNDYFGKNQDLIKLLNSFFNYKLFSKNINPHIKEKKILEIILYGFRFCVKSISSENTLLSDDSNDIGEKGNKNFYKSLLSKNYNESINNNYIPGIDNPEYLHLVTLETIIDHLNTKPDRHGCYVCSCGYYYDIDPCGFPTKNRTFDCPVCGLKIGWGPKPVKVGEETHGMVIRPGHLRIFKDEKAKKYQMRVFDEVDENIPNMILDDYIKNVIEPIRKKNQMGIGECSKNYFLKKNKIIRNLSQIGYRLLNYIFYCHLFFGYIIGNISEIDLNKYLVKNMTIIEVIEADWKLLKESLEEKNIDCIQIFMNLIFDDISELIKNCNYFEKPEEREKFENEIEKIIIKYSDKYDDFSDIYIEENKLQMKFDDYYNIETIIAELIPISEDIYNENDYPMLKYFFLTKYKSKFDCLNHIPDNNKYSLIYQILNEKSEYLLLKYLPKFNNFINYMNKKYSFKITREEAHKRKLKDENIINDKEFIKKFNDFIEVWNIIKFYAKKYKCNSEMSIKELNINDNLSFFLNDISEYGFGMYLSAASQSFIEWQNSFLNNIIENNLSKSSILNKYVNNIKNKIAVNEAKENQILLIEERIHSSHYKDICEIIYSLSERDILKSDKINYNDYNHFIYDYDKIEEELGKIILPGIQLFKSEDDLELVIYWGEGFKGKRSQIPLDFYLKYPQKEFDNNEKELIFNYLKDKIKPEIIPLNNILTDNDILKNLFGFTQMLIIYLTTKKFVKTDTPILSIIKSLSSEYDFPNIFLEFLTLLGNKITIEKIMNLFTIFEHLCFNELLKLLKNEYREDIKEKIQNDIINKIENNEKNLNKIYSKKDLAKALRRLISRYLIGTGDINDIKTENDLFFELNREDLWDEKIKKIEDFDKEIKEDFEEFKLKVNQAYSLYNLIGNEDREEIENFLE